MSIPPVKKFSVETPPVFSGYLYTYKILTMTGQIYVSYNLDDWTMIKYNINNIIDFDHELVMTGDIGGRNVYNVSMDIDDYV